MTKRVYLSPSDQNNNAYAYGSTTEDIQCGKIAEACKTALERNGVEVMMEQYVGMYLKCVHSNQFGADLHVPIHTNAYNGNVTGTRVFYYNTASAGYTAAKKVYEALSCVTPGTSDNITPYPNLYEVSKPAAPTVYVECEFHDVVDTAKWIIANTTVIGEAIAKGICDYFGITFKDATKKEEVKNNKDNVTKTEPEYTLKQFIKDVQSVTGSKVDGIAGNETIGNTITLSKTSNSRHPVVKYIQKRLIAEGYSCGSSGADGVIGEHTTAAIIAYQKANGCTADGEITAKALTWNKLLGIK